MWFDAYFSWAHGTHSDLKCMAAVIFGLLLSFVVAARASVAMHHLAAVPNHRYLFAADGASVAQIRYPFFYACLWTIYEFCQWNLSLFVTHSQFLKLLCSAQIARMLHYTIVLSSDKNNLFVHQSQNNIDRNDRVRAHTYKQMGFTIKSRKVGTKFAFDPISIHLNTHTSTPGTVRSSEKKRTFNCECITVNFSIQFELMCWAQFFASNFDVFSLFFDSLSTKCRNHFKMIADFPLFRSDFVYKIENFDHKMY